MKMNDDNKYCVPDLAKERQNCRFNQLEITHLLDNGAENTKLRHELEKYFLSNPLFNDDVPVDYLSHSERYSNELRKACAMVQCFLSDPTVQSISGQMEGIRMLMGSGLGSAINKDGNPLALHYIMFLPALVSQASQDQMAHWIGRAWAGDIIGTYAQTELGHGSFLRGLETTATYDPTSREFVLHSPTVTSSKWWPGGLGKTANHAVVMAQLYTGGVCRGPHAFVVQLRDLDTHKSLPGITVGEIGPRLGSNSQDNGFLRLDQVRVPRSHMLMQHAQVTEAGDYIQPASSKLTYGTMVFVRVAICFDAGRQLQRAVTIATRYSAVRRQSEMVPGEGEVQVLDYQTQQHKLLPQIATVFAVMFSARRLWDTYNTVTHDLKDGHLALLPELHALSCGLKALCSTDCSEGCDICRLACGGHGYLASSNLPRLVTAITATQTYEGENTVMWLQVARYLLKVYSEGLEAGEPVGPSVQFLKEGLSEPPPASEHSDARLSNYGLVQGWRRAVVALLQEAQREMQARVKQGQQPDRARDACALLLTSAAQCYIRGHMCEQFVLGVTELQGLSAGTVLLLQQLCRLYLLYHATCSSSQLLRHGWLSTHHVSKLEAEYRELLTLLRSDAVSLVDAFDIDDRILNSTLGAWDGRVYDRLYEEALKSPLNKEDVPDAFHKYLRPLLKAKL